MIAAVIFAPPSTPVFQPRRLVSVLTDRMIAAVQFIFFVST